MPIQTSDGATVQLSLHDFRQVERQLDELRDQLQKARQQPAPQPVEQHTNVALEALQSALEVVQFAVGNLPPETTRRWPFGALEALAKQLDILYPHDPDTQTLGITLRQFAGECAQVAEFRGARREIAKAVLAADPTEPDGTVENVDSP